MNEIQTTFCVVIRMREKTVMIRNKAGIHCRPSSAIMLAAADFPGTSFLVTAAAGSTELKSILDLLALGLQKGDRVTVRATGPNENEACEKIAGLFEKEFDFI